MKADRLVKVLQSSKRLENDVKIFAFQHNDDPFVIPDPGNKEESDYCFAKYLTKYYKDPAVHWIPLDVYTNQTYWEDFDEPEEGEERPVWKRLREIAEEKRASDQVDRL